MLQMVNQVYRTISKESVTTKRYFGFGTILVLPIVLLICTSAYAQSDLPSLGKFVSFPESNFAPDIPMLSSEVSLQPFDYAEAPVTERQWVSIMGTLLKCGSEFELSGQEKFCPDCPVTCVGWNDIQEFLFRLNRLNRMTENAPYFYNLPTLGQQLFALRAVKDADGTFSVSDVPPSDHDGRATTVSSYFDGLGTVHPIKRGAPNSAGIYDIGNVNEMTRSNEIEQSGATWLGGKVTITHSKDGVSEGTRSYETQWIINPSKYLSELGGWNYSSASQIYGKNISGSSLPGETRYHTVGFRLVRIPKTEDAI